MIRITHRHQDLKKRPLVQPTAAGNMQTYPRESDLVRWEIINWFFGVGRDETTLWPLHEGWQRSRMALGLGMMNFFIFIRKQCSGLSSKGMGNDIPKPTETVSSVWLAEGNFSSFLFYCVFVLESYLCPLMFSSTHRSDTTFFFKGCIWCTKI